MGALPAAHASVLGQLVHLVETPCYVYFADDVLNEVRRVRAAFDGRFEISFAVKSNPNLHVLRELRTAVDGFDASSAGEVDRALLAGCAPSAISFSGPAKRPFELRHGVETGCSPIVCESAWEIEALDALATDAGKRVRILIRINPADVPEGFGVRMAGKPSQFGIDEEALADVLLTAARWRSLDLVGFHIYSGTNSLDARAIAANFQIFADLFTRFSGVAGIRPEVLVFGSGFGIPYHDGQRTLSLEVLAPLVNEIADRLKSNRDFVDTRLVLEMGRFLVGPQGYFLTSVVDTKTSRGKHVCLCDGGFNNHLAACGMMGTIIRRNWPMWNLTAAPDAALRAHMVAGPLCTTIDMLGTDVELPELRRGDVLAIGSSGAYGRSASPERFISHPPPREYLVSGATAFEPVDISDGLDTRSPQNSVRVT